MQDINVAVPRLASATDPHKPTWVLADLGASGYALPDRGLLLKPDARFKEARENTWNIAIAKSFRTAIGLRTKISSRSPRTIPSCPWKPSLRTLLYNNVAFAIPAPLTTTHDLCPTANDGSSF